MATPDAAFWNTDTSRGITRQMADLVRQNIINGPARIKEAEENTVPKNTRGRRAAPSAKLQEAKGTVMTAAAEKAAIEITSAWKEWEPEDQTRRVEVWPPSFIFTVMTSANWRKITLLNGHEMTWQGGVRHGARGQLLFQFIPELNSELSDRGATMVEVPHTELNAAFGSEFNEWLCEGLGVTSLDALIEQARIIVDPEDVARAEVSTKIQEEQEAKNVLTENPNWGTWA